MYSNVDFYSATVYYSLGIPTDLFTPIFAISRAAGWTAQVLEQLEDNRLYRPLTWYTGPTEDQPVPPTQVYRQGGLTSAEERLLAGEVHVHSGNAAFKMHSF